MSVFLEETWNLVGKDEQYIADCSPTRKKERKAFFHSYGMADGSIVHSTHVLVKVGEGDIMISIGQAFFLQESLPFHVPSLLTLLLYHLSFFFPLHLYQSFFLFFF